MEAYFHHGIKKNNNNKKKVYLSQFKLFFLSIASLYLTIASYKLIIASLHLANDFFLRNLGLHLTIFHRIVRKKSKL